MDLIIRGGTVFTDGLEIQADLGVTEGRVTHLGEQLEPGAESDVIDASGRYVFPGGVELLGNDEPLTPQTAEEGFQWLTGMAALGGVTSVVRPLQPRSGSSVKESLEAITEAGLKGAFVDVGFHLAASDTEPDTLGSRIREASQAGMASVWLTPDWPEGLGGSFESRLAKVIRETGDTVLILVPAWDSSIPSLDRREPSAESKSLRPEILELPVWLEAQMLQRLAAVARAAGGRVLVRSISSRSALEILKRSREEGEKVLAAASIAHLAGQVESAQPGDSGVGLPCWPPLRGKSDQAYLWFLLEEGLIPLVTSNVGLPVSNAGDPAGGPGSHPASAIALLWSVLFTEGVLKNRLSLATLVQAMAGDPAKLAGMYPRKGSLLIGSDADLVLFNPETAWTVGEPAAGSESGEAADGNASDSAANAVPSAPFQGATLQGVVERVFLRGHEIVRDNAVVGQPGVGRYLERRLQIG
jgi:dihydropyrimidinase